jgi:lipoprotein NlpI
MQASSVWLPRLLTGFLVLAVAGCKPKAPSEAGPDSTDLSTNATTVTVPPPAPAPALNGSDAKSYVEYGKENGARGDLNAALEAFDTAMSIDPKYAPAYYNRGVAKLLQHDLDEAFEDFSKSIELDPNYKEAYFQRGCLEGRQGNFDAAIADFNVDIKLDPKYALAHYNLGHATYFKGDLDGTLADLDDALKLDPELKLAYYIRGIVLHAQGHRQEALAELQKSLGFNFANAAFWVWILETEMNQTGLARKDLTDAMAKPQTFNLGEWPTPVGNFLLGKATQEDLLALAQQDAPPDEKADRLCQAWFYIGVSKQVVGDIAGARDSFTKAIAQNAKGSEESVEAARMLAAMPAP